MANVLLETLLNVSEKAANIARVCREDSHLFDLLIQQKTGAEANSRFVEDFKTLADVLIQETIKRDVGRKFAGLTAFIKGEESNTFCNKLGEYVTVEVKSTEQETCQMLSSVLNGDTKAAEKLAAEVHRNVFVVDINPDTLKRTDIEEKTLGIWIDPIDSTLEYINAIEREESNIYVSGLRCVTVLIGVYNRHTGQPIMGVINQPFHEQNSSGWTGKHYWGFAPTQTTSLTSKSTSQSETKIIISGSESNDIKLKLKNAGFELVEAAGAGYKILAVIRSEADAYVLSKGSTFKWDTCGPQAVLLAVGGNVVDFGSAMRKEVREIEYKEIQGGDNCNNRGIIAFRSLEVMRKIVDVLLDV